MQTIVANKINDKVKEVLGEFPPHQEMFFYLEQEDFYKTKIRHNINKDRAGIMFDDSSDSFKSLILHIDKFINFHEFKFKYPDLNMGLLRKEIPIIKKGVLDRLNDPVFQIDYKIIRYGFLWNKKKILFILPFSIADFSGISYGPKTLVIELYVNIKGN